MLLLSIDATFMEHFQGLKRESIINKNDDYDDDDNNYNNNKFNDNNNKNNNSDNNINLNQKIFSIVYLFVIPKLVKAIKEYVNNSTSYNNNNNNNDDNSNNNNSNDSMSDNNNNKTLYEKIKSYMKIIIYYTKQYCNSLLLLVPSISEFIIGLNKLFYLLKITNFHHPFFGLNNMKLVKNLVINNNNNNNNNQFIQLSLTASVLLLIRTAQWFNTNDLTPYHISNRINNNSYNENPLFPKPFNNNNNNNNNKNNNSGSSKSSNSNSNENYDINTNNNNSSNNNNNCPICKETITNPCVLLSGFVFCYRCVLPVIKNTGKCPVTGLNCSDKTIIRLFESSNDNK